MKPVAYLHKGCSDSYRLFKRLSDAGLAGKIVFLDTEKNPFQAYSKGILSVPAVEWRGAIIFQGRIWFDALRNMVEKGELLRKRISVDEAVDGFLKGVLSAFTAVAWAYVRWSLRELASFTPFSLAVTGLTLHSGDVKKAYWEFRRAVAQCEAELLEEIRVGMLKSIAGNFARELYWVHGMVPDRKETERLYPFKVFSHWLMLRPTYGRVGIILRKPEDGLENRLLEAYEYTLSRLEEIKGMVEEEQGKLLRDKEFLALFK